MIVIWALFEGLELFNGWSCLHFARVPLHSVQIVRKCGQLRPVGRQLRFQLEVAPI